MKITFLISGGFIGNYKHCGCPKEIISFEDSRDVYTRATDYAERLAFKEYMKWEKENNCSQTEEYIEDGFSEEDIEDFKFNISTSYLDFGAREITKENYNSIMNKYGKEIKDFSKESKVALEEFKTLNNIK